MIYEIEYSENTASIFLNDYKIVIDKEDDFVFLTDYSWYISSHGYVYGFLNIDDNFKENVILSRIITACPSNKVVDHINHDLLDNRKSNLRICTKAQNHMNSIKNTPRSSIYKGVYWDKRKNGWIAQIGFQGRKICLGKHPSEESAARAYDRKAKELFKNFSNLNFPTEI
jgi:hypothetical protein